MPKDLDPRVAELEELLIKARTRPHAFALAKNKDGGIVLKADPKLKAEMMVKQCKAAGGQAPFMVQGTLSTSGRLFQFTVDSDLPKSLPLALKQYFQALKIKCKAVFVLPGGAVVDEDAAAEPAPNGAAAPAVETPPPAEGGSGGDPGEGDTRASLMKEFEALTADLKALVAGAETGIGQKALALVKLFGETVKADLAKARQVIDALKKYVAAELAKLPKPDPSETGTGEGGILAGVQKVGEKLAELGAEAADAARTAARKLRDELRPEADRKDLAALEALGYSWEDADKLLAGKETDKDIVEKALTARMERSGVPEERRAKLLEAAKDSPKTFAATLKSIEALESGGPVAITPEAMQQSREKLEMARQDKAKADKALAEAEAALAAQLEKIGSTSAAGKAASAALAAAEDALKVFKARLGDVSKLSPAEATALAQESNKLIGAVDLAKRAAEQALEAEKQATMDYATLSEARSKAEAEAEKQKGPLESARKEAEAKEGKKALLDAMSFGPLSAGQKKLSDDDKAALASAFGKDPVVAKTAIGIAMNAPNPAAVAKHAAQVADKAEDGFADAAGKALDLPIDARRKMAANALRMGGMLGEDYFTGFEDYLKSGKQHEPDPHGGLDAPLKDQKLEAVRLKQIAVKRTSAMGEALLTEDGKVDFNSDKAKAAMDQLMFHPGALTVATPMVSAKVAETKKLFEDPATKERAQEIIGASKVAKPPLAGVVASADLIARTTGKDPATLTDADAKAAVLSAMMTPMSQGPVGSCFATAQLRNIRENDPLKAMDEYAKLASTGQFTAADGMVYPANRGAPQGENPLMRSWEYTVATATEEQQSGARRKELNDALLPGGTPPKGLSKIGEINGLKAKWTVGAVTEKGIEPGIRRKLQSAIAKDLKFEYAADLDTPKVGGGGDGHSTNGVYQIKYKGKLLASEADFKAAMQEMALAAAGVEAGSTEGQAVVALVTSPAFVTEVLDAYGPAPAKGERTSPWNQGGGAFPSGTKQVLTGSPSVDTQFVAQNAGTPRGDRNKDLLKGMIGQHAGMAGEFGLLWTSGKNADHVFNALPNHPSAAKLKRGNLDDAIRTELLEPGQKAATTKLPKEQARALFESQLSEHLGKGSDAEAALLLQALKNAPTAEMTPKEVADKVELELAAWKEAVAQRELDEWFEQNNKELKAKGKAELAPHEKAGYLQWFRDRKEGEVKAAAAEALSNAIDLPEVVIADTNWGGSDHQIFFVMRPDPLTGELAMYRKDAVSGKLTPADAGWSDATYRTVK